MAFPVLCMRPMLLLLLLTASHFMVHGEEQQFMLNGEPEDTEAIAGSEVVLRCRISNAVGIVQWTQNGFGLGSGRRLEHLPRYSIVGNEARGEYDLRIEELQLSDDAEYECQVGATEYMPGLRSEKAHVTVLVPPSEPEIEHGPVVSVVDGEAYNLTCSAGYARPAPTVSWSTTGQTRMNSTHSLVTVLADGKRENVTAVLTIHPTRSDQGLEYRCSIMNSALHEPKYTAATLDVLYQPEVAISVQPEGEIREFDSMTITCEAAGKPNVIGWRWYRDGTEMTDNVGENVLHLREITYKYHNNHITCEATNSAGSSQQSHTLTVLYGPRFPSPPLHAAVDVGQEATMECYVDGNPEPSISWSRKDDPDSILATSSTTTIKEVEAEDFGVYLCTASSTGFSDAQMEVHLVENGPPTLMSEEEQVARLKDTGYIVCEAHSAPKPNQMLWSRDGERLNFSQLNRYTVQEEDTVLGRRSTLQIARVQEVDYGRYSCAVDNEYGQQTQFILFRQQVGISIGYILAGAAGVIVLVLVICIIFVLCHHRRQVACCAGRSCPCCTASDANSEGSEASLNKKPVNDRPDIIVQYKTDHHDNPVNSMKPKYDQKYVPSSPDYDEVRYPTLPIDPRNPALPQDYTDYGYDGPQPEYSTFPRSAPRYEPTYLPPPSNFTDIYTLPNRAYTPSNYGRISPHPAPPPCDYSTVIPRTPASDYGTLGSRPPSRQYGAVSPHPAVSDYGRISPPHQPMSDYGRASPHPSLSSYRPVSPPLAPVSEYDRASLCHPPSDYGTVPSYVENIYGRVASPVDSRLSTNV